MAGALKVLACVDWDQASQTCTTQAWIDPPTIIPTLTVDQGSEVGVAILWCIVSIKVVMMLRQAIADRIGS